MFRGDFFGNSHSYSEAVVSVGYNEPLCVRIVVSELAEAVKNLVSLESGDYEKISVN